MSSQTRRHTARRRRRPQASSSLRIRVGSRPEKHANAASASSSSCATGKPFAGVVSSTRERANTAPRGGRPRWRLRPRTARPPRPARRRDRARGRGSVVDAARGGRRLALASPSGGGGLPATASILPRGLAPLVVVTATRPERGARPLGSSSSRGLNQEWDGYSNPSPRADAGDRRFQRHEDRAAVGGEVLGDGHGRDNNNPRGPRYQPRAAW